MVRYYIKSGISKVGPFSIDSLQSMAKANQLQAIDLLAIDGKNWIQARFIPGLFSGDSDVAGVITADFNNKAVKKYDSPEFFTVLKVLIPACIVIFLFGLFLGWIFFAPAAKTFALVQEDRDKLEVENKSLSEAIRTIYIPKIDHQKEVDKSSSESQAFINKLQNELKSDKFNYDGTVLGFQEKLKKAADESKEVSKKLEMIEEAIQPFKELVNSLPDEPKLLELFTRLQQVPEVDRNQAVVNCLNALGELKGDIAQFLKSDYKINRNRFNESIADLIISWSLSIQRLEALSTTHKNTEACKTVMNDLNAGKDLVGMFMLEQFADPNKSEMIQSKINSSIVPDEIKKKALASLEKAQINATGVLEFLKIEAESKPKSKIKQNGQGLQKKAQDLIMDIALKTRDENPVRYELHGLQLEALSEMVKDLVLMKAFDKDLENDLKKYKFFIPFGKTIESNELREDFSKKVYEKSGDMSSRKPDDLKKHLEAIAANYQIIEIAGLISVK
jgi:hypothetical protein